MNGPLIYWLFKLVSSNCKENKKKPVKRHDAFKIFCKMGKSIESHTYSHALALHFFRIQSLSNNTRRMRDTIFQTEQNRTVQPMLLLTKEEQFLFLQ